MKCTFCGCAVTHEITVHATAYGVEVLNVRLLLCQDCVQEHFFKRTETQSYDDDYEEEVVEDESS